MPPSATTFLKVRGSCCDVMWTADGWASSQAGDFTTTTLKEIERDGAALQRMKATPDFLSRLVALAGLMRLSLLKAAHVAVAEGRVAGNPGTLPGNGSFLLRSRT